MWCEYLVSQLRLNDILYYIVGYYVYFLTKHLFYLKLDKQLHQISYTLAYY